MSSADQARADAATQPANDPPLQIDPEWIEAFGPGELLPPSLAAWRPLVVEGLAQFLNGLPPQRLGEIVASQLALADDATAHERLVALLLQCPTLHKLGQVVARQPHLDEALRQRLRALESMPSTLDEADMAALLVRLHAELPATAALAIDRRPLAQGSVAVVLPFEWRDDGSGAKGQAHEGVFKLLKPGVVERLAQELALLPQVAAFLERRGAELGLPALDYRDTLDGVGRLLGEETRLDHEQANLRAAHAFYADEPRILVPALLPWCTPWATAMQRVRGVGLADAALPPQQRATLAATALSALLAKPFWTLADPALFHGDLHGGNLLVTADGRLAVLDWALVARVGKRHREAVVAAVIGGLTLDATALRAALAELGGVDADDAALAAQVERSLDALVRAGRPAGFDWLLGLLDAIALDGRIRFDAQLSVFRKTWLSLAGVLGDLAGDAASPDAALIEAGVRRFMAEWPARWQPAAGADAFATHVSNAELAAAMVSACFTGMRWWSRRLAPSA